MFFILGEGKTKNDSFDDDSEEEELGAQSLEVNPINVCCLFMCHDGNKKEN